MVVIGIIGLLIAIVVPSVNAARVQANVAATNATLRAIDTGTEMFRSEARFGGVYPPSAHVAPESPHDSSAAIGERVVGGANLIVWALAGADLLGTPGFRNIDGGPDPFGGWVTDTGKNVPDPANPATADLHGILANGRPAQSRATAYVEVSKMTFPEPVDDTDPDNADFRLPVDSQDTMNSLCFLDNFNQPVLYFRANRNAQFMVTRQDPMNGGEGVVAGVYAPNGIYNLADNALIVRPGGTGSPTNLSPPDLGAGRNHPLLNIDTSGTRGTYPPPPGTFDHTVWDPNIRPTTSAGITVARPHRADSFILLSAGPDGLYGTADDIGNFPINH